MFVLTRPTPAKWPASAKRPVRTYHVETWDLFGPAMVEGKQVAGVTAGASTPQWVIADFVHRLEPV